MHDKDFVDKKIKHTYKFIDMRKQFEGCCLMNQHKKLTASKCVMSHFQCDLCQANRLS